MAANGHAILSSSASHRWLECTPSARLAENFENKSSEFATLGTIVHAMCEIKLCKALGLECSEVIPDGVEITEEMEESSDAYVSYILELLSEIKKSCADPQVLVEQHLDFSNFVPEGYGTGDCLIVADGTLYVIDYKNGTGIKVSSYMNPQLLLYSLGALNLFDCIYDVEKVSMTIFQPRIGNVSTFEISKKDLLTWAHDYLEPRAKLAFEGKGEFVAGDHCQFCPCKVRCAHLAKTNMKMAKYEFADPVLLDDDEIEEIISNVDNLVNWANSIKDYALNEALKGKKWTRFKLVEGRSNRKLTDEEKVADILINAGFDPYEKKICSITELQKRLGKARFVELLNSYVYKPQGKPTLVDITDKRPEFNLAKKDFIENEDKGDK